MGNLFYTILIYPLTQLIELVFTFCDKLFNDEGIALIGVSFAVSLFTLPLYIVAEAWQQKERDVQKQMKAQVDRIKSTFSGNEQYMILTTYYNQCHYHPIMALRSAFGLLIQVPFFMAAYTCLSNMSALKGSWFLIFRDLGEPDAIFKIGNFNVNILPIAMTIINIVSGAIYLRGLPFRDKLQTYGLALVFLAALYNSPSGLVIYWTMNNVFSLVKNIFYKLKHPVKVLYIISCVAVTILIVWLLASNELAFVRAILVAGAFSLVYFAPLFVKLSNWLVDNNLSRLRDNSTLRLSLFVFSCCALTLLIGMFLPTQLIVSSPMEFSGIDGYGSPMFFVWNTFFQAMGLCIVWPILIYFLYKERIQTLLSFSFFALLFLSLINIFAFAGDYGTLSKHLVFTGTPNVDSSINSVLSNFLVLAIFIVGFVLLLKRPLEKIYIYIVAFVCIGFFAISVKNSFAIKSGYADYERVSKNGGLQQQTLEPIFNFSKTGKNVLLIFLDRAQSCLIKDIWEESPRLNEQYSGFTLYRNTVSYNASTLLAAPATYGGYEYSPEEINRRKNETLIEKQNQALLVLPRIFSEQAENYSVTVTDPSWANFSWIPDLSIYKDFPKISAFVTQGVYLDLWYKQHSESANFNVTSSVLKRNILWYGLFRASPLALRPGVYNDGKYWSTDTKNINYDDFFAQYSVLEYLPRLSNFDSELNSFISITNATTHESMLLQPPEYIPAAQIDETKFAKNEYGIYPDYHSQAGAMKRIGEFFEVLKLNGVYDNTRIIIYADHGGGHFLSEDFAIDIKNTENMDLKYLERFFTISPNAYNPLLMVKDFGETGDLKITYDFMVNSDVPALATADLGFIPKNPYTGNVIDSSMKEKGALVCTEHMFMPYQTKSKNIFTVKPDSWYRVKENIFDFDNWVQEIQGENK